jgi:cell division protein FtsW (lipid II flippase)
MTNLLCKIGALIVYASSILLLINHEKIENELSIIIFINIIFSMVVFFYGNKTKLNFSIIIISGVLILIMITLYIIDLRFRYNGH